MLDTQNTAVVLVDIQGTILRAMHGHEAVLQSVIKLARGAKALGVPVIFTEQNPERLGSTLPEVAEIMGDAKAVAKMSFSCCQTEAFMQALAASGRNQIVIAGIEAHVCVYQTAAELVGGGFEVQVVCDAVSSRTLENKEIGLRRMSESHVGMTSVETVLFELLKAAGGDCFKEILKIVK